MAAEPPPAPLRPAAGWRKAEDAGRGASGSEARRRRDGGPGRKMVAVGVVGARSWLAVGGLRWSRAVEGVW